MLPPGRARLCTKPWPTGSTTSTKTVRGASRDDDAAELSNTLTAFRRVCARAEIIEELKSAETKALVTTDIKSPRAITETPVLLQSLLSVNLCAPSTLNNRERLLRK